jgi:DNA-binding CsgD family transcriptional regulator
MGKSQHIHEHDVKAMLNLMGQLANLPADAATRTEHAMKGIAGLVGADFGFSTRFRSSGPGKQVQPYAILSHGWTTEQLAEGICVAAVDPFHDYVNDDMQVDGPRNGWPFVLVTDRLERDRARRRAEHSEQFSAAMGGDLGMAVIHPATSEGHFATLALVRADSDRRPFTDREVQIARLMWGATEFLHRKPLAAVEDKLWGTQLSPRLSQVLEGLRQGLSIKQVAHRLGLSIHTVHDYTKDLYRRFGVSSRGELLALWLK